MATIILRVIMLIFFCKQLIQVLDYGEPQINSYEIMEDRADMEEAILLGESKVDFVVGFLNEAYVPVELDPRFGKLELYHHA